MSLRNWVLTAVLALQVAILVAVFWPESAGPGVVQLFAGVEPGNIVRVKISNSSGLHILLARGADGCVLPEAEDYPCLGSKLSSFLDRIAALQTDQLVAKTGASHSRLRVADGEFQKLVELELADGSRHKLYLGTTPRPRTIHVRADNQDSVYLASTMSSSEAGVAATAWIESAYFSVPEREVTAVVVENSEGRFEIEKDADGEWTVKGLAADETLDALDVRAVVFRAASISMRRPLGKTERDDYGFQALRAVVTVTTRDGEEHVLQIGAEMDGDAYVMKSSESPYYVLVPDFEVKNLVESGRADMVQVPLEPAPAATSTPQTAP